MENSNQVTPSQTSEQIPPTSETKKWYKHKGVLAVIILVILVAGATVVYFEFNKAQNTKPISLNDELTTGLTSSTTESSLSVPAGWKTYHNDIFGLSFSYPPKWEDVTTYPSTDITNLKTVRSNMDNSFDPSVNINFSENDNPNFPTSAPQISMWSPQYGGPQYNGSGMGHIDNLLSLTASDNACNYKINYQNVDSLQEIYSSCQNGVKIAVVEQTQHFNPESFPNNPAMPNSGILYTYSLNYYGYKLLQNGSFDYLLTSYTATSTRQQALKLTADEFIKQAGATQGNYPNLAEFITFVQSIKSYSPPAPETQTFNTPAGEDPNITLIRKYYYLIATGQLNDAYALLANPASSQQKFQEDNQNVYTIQPRDFKQLADNKYELWVDYHEDNTQPQQQRLIVEITNGKIKQDLFETLTSSITKFEDTLAYGASRGDKDIVVIKQGNNESIIDSAANNFDKSIGSTLIFNNVNFSPKGNYLTYTAGGYEWSYLRVYDVANKKQVLETEGGHGEFNPAETIYFFCNKNDMDGNYQASVYQVPGFTLKLDLLKMFPELSDYANVSCSADQQKNTLQFNFSGKYDKDQNYDETASKIYNLNLDTGELIN